MIPRREPQLTFCGDLRRRATRHRRRQPEPRTLLVRLPRSGCACDTAGIAIAPRATRPVRRVGRQRPIAAPTRPHLRRSPTPQGEEGKLDREMPIPGSPGVERSRFTPRPLSSGQRSIDHSIHAAGRPGSESGRPPRASRRNETPKRRAESHARRRSNYRVGATRPVPETRQMAAGARPKPLPSIR